MDLMGFVLLLTTFREVLMKYTGSSALLCILLENVEILKVVHANCNCFILGPEEVLYSGLSVWGSISSKHTIQQQQCKK